MMRSVRTEANQNERASAFSRSANLFHLMLKTSKRRVGSHESSREWMNSLVDEQKDPPDTEKFNTLEERKRSEMRFCVGSKV